MSDTQAIARYNDGSRRGRVAKGRGAYVVRHLGLIKTASSEVEQFMLRAAARARGGPLSVHQH